MRWLRKLRLRLESLFRRTRVETDLDDELRDYLEREMEVAASAGLPPDEARRQALSSLRGVQRLREECRDARGLQWFESTVTDVRLSIRTLRKTPAFTVTVVAALAFCIGANTAIFSVVDTVLFRPLPFPEQERLVAVSEGIPGLGFPVLPFSCPDYLFVEANNQSFEATGVYRTQSYEISGAGQPQRVIGARASASLVHVLGIAPAVGRTFTRDEDEHSKRVAVLMSGLARSFFGSPEGALGRTILLDRIPYTVIGVMPASFSFPIRGARANADPAELFVPVSWSNYDRQQNVNDFKYSMVARLKPGVAIEQAGTEVHRLLQQVVADYPQIMKEALRKLPKFSLDSRVVPFREEFTGDVQRPLLLLLAAVGVVLLIGCADIANLMFSRMVGRRQEFAVRSALGASNARLARQAITEGLVLSAAGGAIGLCVAFWTLPLLVRFAPENLPRLSEIGLNWRMLVFTAAVVLVTPLVFCLGPLASTLRADALRGGGRTTTESGQQRRMMSAVVVVQFSLACVLLTTAGLLTRSLIKSMQSNPGFRPEHVVSARVSLPDQAYKASRDVGGLFNQLLDRVNTLPGVRQAGAISDLPTVSSSNVVITIEGRLTETVRTDMLFCRGNALETLGVSLRKGRLLRPEDYLANTHVAVVSEALARQVSPTGDPLGRRFKFGVNVPINGEPWITIVGVVGDVKARFTSNSERLLMFTTPRDWVKQMNIIVRTSVDPMSIANSIRRELNALDASLPLEEVQTLDQVITDSLSAERFRTWLLACFAGAALVLATLGIAGLLAYNVARRTKEFGVRIAMGADQRDLLALILRHSLWLAGVGITVGLAASMFVSRMIAALLYDTSPLDPATFGLVALVLVLVAIGSALIPAWRVIRIDPVGALRAE